MSIAINVPTIQSFVLDTNVVLDWLIFDDPAVHVIRDAVLTKRVSILRSPDTLTELQRVLTYKPFKIGAERQADIVARYEKHTSPALLPADFSRDNLLLPLGFPLCRDCDDQVFLAICLHAQAAGVISRDKQVLKLMHRAQRFGVRVLSIAAASDIILSMFDKNPAEHV